METGGERHCFKWHVRLQVASWGTPPPPIVLRMPNSASANWTHPLSLHVHALAMQYAVGVEAGQRPRVTLRREVRVICFGGFRIIVDGQPADLDDLRPVPSPCSGCWHTRMELTSIASG
jgi:hypothetical protein